MDREYAVPNKLAIRALEYLDSEGGRVPIHNKFGIQLWECLLCCGYIMYSWDADTGAAWESYGNHSQVIRRHRVSAAFENDGSLLKYIQAQHPY